MSPQKEPYAYFQPGEIVYFISHERDQPINPKARDPETNRPIYVESRGPQSNQPFDPDDIDDDDDDDDDDEKAYDKKIDDLISWSKDIAKGIKPDLTISRVKQREIHFPGTRNEEPAKGRIRDSSSEPKNNPPEHRSHGAFSLIPAKVRLGEINEEIGEKLEQYVDIPELAELVMRLDEARDRADQPLKQNGLKLEAVSPNWLCSPCSEWGGGGGPGGIPEPYSDIPDNQHPFDLSHKALLNAALGKEGKGVTVAILDTAPCLHDLADIYERYHKVNPENQREHHPLIESLLRPNGRLVVHPASFEELLRMRAVHLRDHNYEMTDHGLFVAGIIHSLAEQAEIHLYEVLNPQGVGDLLSIAHGFWRVFNRFSREQLVVNASLVLKIPRPYHPISDFDPALMAKIIKDWENQKKESIKWLTPELLSEEGKEWLARQGAAIEWICDHLYFRGSRVIAAAGNDWRSEESPERPHPGFPAAFDRVLGIGALPKNALPDATTGKYPVSSYSNLSDEPEEINVETKKEVGVTTLGGLAGKSKGVLGIYIGEFPDMKYRLEQYHWLLRPIMWVIFTLSWGNCIRPRNNSHWAWWCGTSFATPIITGLTAAVLSELNQPAQRASTQEAIDEMYDLDGILTKLTAYKEDGVEKVNQPS